MKKRVRFIKKMITFIGSFIAALSVVAQFFPSAFSFLEGIPNLDNIILILVVLLLLGLFFMNWRQFQEENDYKLYIEHDATHKYAHLIRDTIYRTNCLISESENDIVANDILVKFCKNVTECLEKSLYSLTGADEEKNELMVCIKVLSMEFWNNSKLANVEEKKQITYRTIARSITPKGALQRDDAVPHKIEECTPFYQIFCELKHDWTGINLSSAQKNLQIVSEDTVLVGQEYLETCPTWSEHYNNKIVIPIRVKLSEIDDNYMESDERNLFGFLCVECKNNSLNRISDTMDEELISICDYLKTYADSMYVVMDNIYKKTSYNNK